MVTSLVHKRKQKEEKTRTLNKNGNKSEMKEKKLDTLKVANENEK